MARRLRASAPAATSVPAGPTTTVQRPDPEAWGLACLYALGDTRRLRVLDSRTVLVLNHPA